MKRQITDILYEHYNIKEEVDVTQEGFVRGLGSEFEDIIDDFAAFGDMAHLGRNDVIPKVKKVLLKVRKLLQNRELAIPPGSGVSLLKFRQGWARWRFFYFLNDKMFKQCMDYTEKTGKDPVGWINISFSDRIIPEMYNAKSSKDLEKLLDKYEDRLQEVKDTWDKTPGNLGYGSLLRQGIHGVRDLVIAIRRLVAYNS